MKLDPRQRETLAAKLERRGVDLSRRFSTAEDDRIFFDTMADMGLADARDPGPRVEPPDYTELGMTRKAGAPTKEEQDRYREITAGAELGDDGWVCMVLLADTDLLPDRYGVDSFRTLVGLYSKYLGRANDFNHSFNAKEAGGRIIDMGIGTDPGVELHPHTPVEAMRALDPLNTSAGVYTALYATMAFPKTSYTDQIVESIKSALTSDVSVAFAPSGATCSACLAAMRRYWLWYECLTCGFAGGKTEEGVPVVSIYGDVSDVRVFGHVSDGACKRARYVLDPTQKSMPKKKRRR